MTSPIVHYKTEMKVTSLYIKQLLPIKKSQLSETVTKKRAVKKRSFPSECIMMEITKYIFLLPGDSQSITNRHSAKNHATWHLGNAPYTA